MEENTVQCFEDDIYAALHIRSAMYVGQNKIRLAAIREESTNWLFVISTSANIAV